ncbi:hypothetical protein [Dictyobacter aurantiacus]|uniref:Uncharacterized protein n=1 Tax=Dictyobacter aurantiacus TaxID=1936993 RepID=A0A401ZIG7_9CHLR|nr:hypothetical protein [Dictyobacter aurantiacus]GCE06639.1 hypothetical protein KDAU_39680 [Dictyobacter aurantiacus]
MGTSPYEMKLYIPRQPLTWEWVTVILSQLWKHGIHFTYPAPESLTWDGELQSTNSYVLHSTAETFEGKLRELLAKEKTGIYLTMWDGAIPYDLLFSLDPHEDNNDDLEPVEDAPFGHVSLYCDVTRSNTPIVSSTMESLLPYLQAYRGFLHWSKLLCQIIDPIYALGYTGMSAISGIYGEHGDRPLQEQLARGVLPDIEAILNGEGSCYLAPGGATSEIVQRALAIPDCIVQRLANGGVFFTRAFAPYRYENNIAQQYYLLGEMCLGRQLSGTLPPDLPPLQETDAEKYFQYALTIFSSINDEVGMRAARRQLERDTP